MTDSDSNPYECVVNYSGSDWFHGDKQRLQSPFSLLAVANASTSLDWTSALASDRLTQHITLFFFFFFYYWCLSVFVISTAVMDSTLTSYVVSQWVCEMAARFSKCEDSDPLFTTAHSVGLFMYLSLCMLCVLTCISIIVAWLWWKTKKKKNNLNLCWCSWRNHARAHYILKISNQKNPTPLLLSHKLPRSR